MSPLPVFKKILFKRSLLDHYYSNPKDLLNDPRFILEISNFSFSSIVELEEYLYLLWEKLQENNINGKELTFEAWLVMVNDFLG